MKTRERKGTNTMRKTVFLLAAATLALAIAPAGLAKGPNKEKPPKTFQVKLLAFNDFHGHLEANTPGSIVNPATGLAVPAGGAEYFATHLKALGSEGREHLRRQRRRHDRRHARSLSGLFHDEPTIEFLNSIGVDTIGVGNHEFDEGSGRAAADAVRQPEPTHGGGPFNGSAYTPVRPDGCHPVDGCQDGDAVLRLGLPVPRGERDRQGHGQPAAAAVRDRQTSARARRSPSSARRSRTRR